MAQLDFVDGKKFKYFVSRNGVLCEKGDSIDDSRLVKCAQRLSAVMQPRLSGPQPSHFNSKLRENTESNVNSVLCFGFSVIKWRFKCFQILKFIKNYCVCNFV